MERVNGGEASVSKATVYNTLGLFAAHGLIKGVKVDPSKVFCDSNPMPHHHFYHTTTGELTDFSLEDDKQAPVSSRRDISGRVT